MIYGSKYNIKISTLESALLVVQSIASLSSLGIKKLALACPLPKISKQHAHKLECPFGVSSSKMAAKQATTKVTCLGGDI